MAFPFDITDRSLKIIGGAGAVGIFALWILYKVFLSGQVANSQDLSQIKSDMQEVKQQHMAINQRLDQTDEKIDKMSNELVGEAKKGNWISRGVCYGVHKTLEARAEYCDSPAP